MSSSVENNRYIVQVYVGTLSALYEALSVEASKQTTAEEIVSCIVERLSLGENPGGPYELAEVIGDSFGQECKERSLGAGESPVQLMMLWPRSQPDDTNYRFCLREKTNNDCVWRDNFVMDSQLIKDYFHRFLYQPKDREYPDLCQLPDLNERTLLENLQNRFVAGHIYTYVGSILIALNPFKFLPIYNPKYVKLYQNRRLGPNLPPHIFAVADTAYHCMLKDRKNQCIVISGESGSGKTESTNFLLHHLTALSQKGSHGSGVEQTILSAGPVLEAFGNAKTAHNNNSSRFGKFIQVNYKENGMVHGAVVQKYLLEKSRICTQGRNERNYHVFYYLLEGANEQERQLLHLKRPDQYCYLNKSTNMGDAEDYTYEFSRLKQSMEMVGFTSEKQRRLFSVLSAVLLLGNVEFQPRKSAYHHDEAVAVKNPEVVTLISELLRVKQETLMQALTAKRARASGETLVINYRLPEAIASRDALAKCLYGALFDWIVLQVNHALLSKKDTFREHQGNSIGVLDIFGFEDFGLCNSFEQLCINYANEHLQHYFNQHVFKYEQEEYRKEGIRWKNIDFMDNTGCLQLIEGKPNGLLCLLDDQCNFPGATNETLLQKFNSVHKENQFYQKPQKKEGAFIIVHYAGTVKYQVMDMREKNLDLMRQDIVGVLKNSSMAFVRELVGADPVAVFRWAIVRAFFRAHFAFQEAGRRQRQGRVDGNKNNVQQRYQRNHTPNENIISKQRNSISLNRFSLSIETDPHSTGVAAAGNPLYHQQRMMTCRGYNRAALSVKSMPPISGTAKINADETDMRTRRKDSASGLERVLCPDQAKVMQRANQIVMKNKSFRPRERGKKGLKNLQSVKTLAGRTGITGTNQGQLGKARKQLMTVTAQFQQSLHSLMVTLNQANPFFIRCIKSNAKKIPNKFHEETVQRQLRYTGMLETVRIRRAGFNVRLTYDEFIQLYRILLPKGLLSSIKDVCDFLTTLNLDRDNYQLGSSKIFLRESEKYKLDCKLHQQIMASIVTLQRWFRACLERRRFLRIQNAVITIQSYCRMFLVQKCFRTVQAAIRIQKTWRGYRARLWFHKLRAGIIRFQAYARGFAARKMFSQLKEQAYKDRIGGVSNMRLPMEYGSTSTDLAFSNKSCSSQEELEVDRAYSDRFKKFRDSDESSGYVEDLETYQSKPSLRSTQSLPSVTSTHQQNLYIIPNRLEDIKQEGNLLDTSTLKRKVSKVHKTIDYSDIEFSYHHPTTTGSADFLNQNYAQLTGDKKTDLLRNQEHWSSISTQSESDSDYIHGLLVHMPYNENLKMSEQQPVKHPLIRTPHIRQHTVLKRENNRQVAGGDLFNNMAPIRRRDKDSDSSNNSSIHDLYEHAPDKAKQMLGASDMPKPPTRNIRSNRRSQVRSLGEDGLDSAAIERNVNLDTITELGDPDCAKLAGGADSYVFKQSLTPKRTRSGIGLDLKRRNSDPSTKLTAAISDNPEGSVSPQIKTSVGLPELKDMTSFMMAGHHFRKTSKFGEDNQCFACLEKIDLFYSYMYKCTYCKKFCHTKCIQNKRVNEMPCDNATTVDGGKPGRRKHRKPSRAPSDMNKQAVHSKFSLTGTSKFNDRTDQIISDAKELKEMQDFITLKISQIEDSEAGEKSREVDRLFKQALREFKDNLVQLYSTAYKNGIEAYSVKYKDLITNFMQAMDTVCQREQKDKDFPVTMGVNAFRGFMNEFMNSRAEPEKPNKTKRKKEKKRKGDDTIIYSGHTFHLNTINIPTVCEICSSFFMWPIEKCLVCQSCKLTCHKKCYVRTTACMKYGSLVTHDSTKLFGIPLASLLTEDCKIPVVVERLLATIEKDFLYTEGIYRKSGVTSKIKELKHKMETDQDGVNFEDYQVHILASVLKCFLREMPEPLLTFECYENFVTVADTTDSRERVPVLYEMLKKLPAPNYELMERLIFHLARVAQHEEVNRMSASSLAIVFAPCILRTNKLVPAQDSLQDISRQTQCIETIITEQLRKIRATLDDIDTLDTACRAATDRLSSLRSSKVFTADELMPPAVRPRHVDDEENLLENHIEEIRKEKEHLTSTLPTLTHATSDDDMLSTDGDGSLDDISSAAQDQKISKAPVVRSVSSSGASGGGGSARLKRQMSSDVKAGVDECEDTPIMV